MYGWDTPARPARTAWFMPPRRSRQYLMRAPIVSTMVRSLVEVRGGGSPASTPTAAKSTVRRVGGPGPLPEAEATGVRPGSADRTAADRDHGRLRGWWPTRLGAAVRPARRGQCCETTA